jgi:acyl-coenzyme A thioesterase PaaI-like protein
LSRFVDDHYCFACGKENPAGLRVRIDRNDGRCLLSWNPKREFQGFREILHGGIISTLLDEAMAHAVLSVRDGTATAEIRVVFEKPVDTSAEIFVEARVEEENRRLLRASAELLQAGTRKASARATFVQVARPHTGRARGAP